MTAILLAGFASGCGSAASPPAGAPSETQSVKKAIPAAAETSDAAEPTQTIANNEKRNPTSLSQMAAAGVSETKNEPELSDAELREWGIERFTAGKFELLVDQVGPQEGPLLQNLVEQLSRLPGFFEQRFTVRFSPVAGQQEPTFCGHLMRDQQTFLDAGLLPEEFADLSHGKELGTKYWIVDQPTAYYREHLLIHEAVHSLMNRLEHDWPIWYLEGMAECIACHAINDEGDWEFAVVPNWEIVEQGFGRISLLEEECQAGRWQDFSQIRQLNRQNFYPHKTSYAWSWALCLFLAEHPQTKSAFRNLIHQPHRHQFEESLDSLLANGGEQLLMDWAVFLHDFIPDYQFANNQISFAADINTLPTLSAATSFTLNVQHNWQCLPMIIPAARKLTITATGSYQIDDVPVAWVCEPNGVSIDYFQGRPLGELQVAIVPLEAETRVAAERFFSPFPVGLKQEVLAAFPALLFFRINDRGSDRGNNQGTIEILIKHRE